MTTLEKYQSLLNTMRILYHTLDLPPGYTDPKKLIEMTFQRFAEPLIFEVTSND